MEKSFEYADIEWNRSLIEKNIVTNGIGQNFQVISKIFLSEKIVGQIKL